VIAKISISRDVGIQQSPARNDRDLEGERIVFASTAVWTKADYGVI